MQIDILPAKQRLVEPPEAVQRLATPSRRRRLPWNFKKKKAQEIVAERLWIEFTAEISGDFGEDAGAKHAEIDIQIPHHRSMAERKAVAIHEVVGIQENDQVRTRCPSTDIAADARAALCAIARNPSNTRIACGPALHFLRSTVARAIVDYDMFPVGEILGGNAIHRLPQKGHAVQRRRND